MKYIQCWELYNIYIFLNYFVHLLHCVLQEQFSSFCLVASSQFVDEWHLVLLYKSWVRVHHKWPQLVTLRQYCVWLCTCMLVYLNMQIFLCTPVCRDASGMWKL